MDSNKSARRYNPFRFDWNWTLAQLRTVYQWDETQLDGSRLYSSGLGRSALLDRLFLVWGQKQDELYAKLNDTFGAELKRIEDRKTRAQLGKHMSAQAVQVGLQFRNINHAWSRAPEHYQLDAYGEGRYTISDPEERPVDWNQLSALTVYQIIRRTSTGRTFEAEQVSADAQHRHILQYQTDKCAYQTNSGTCFSRQTERECVADGCIFSPYEVDMKPLVVYAMVCEWMRTRERARLASSSPALQVARVPKLILEYTTSFWRTFVPSSIRFYQGNMSMEPAPNKKRPYAQKAKDGATQPVSKKSMFLSRDGDHDFADPILCC